MYDAEACGARVLTASDVLERNDTMVARPSSRPESKGARLTDAATALFETWRAFLTRGLRAASGAAHSVLAGPGRVMRALAAAFTTGVSDSRDANTLVRLGVTAFAFGSLLGITLSSDSDDVRTAVSGAVVWAAWLLVRLFVLRIVSRPRSRAEESGVLAAWGVGLLPFAVAVGYVTSVAAGWLLSLLLTWSVMRRSSIAEHRARQAVLVALGMEVAALVGLALVRNAQVLRVLVGS